MKKLVFLVFFLFLNLGEAGAQFGPFYPGIGHPYWVSPMRGLPMYGMPPRPIPFLATARQAKVVATITVPVALVPFGVPYQATPLGINAVISPTATLSILFPTAASVIFGPTGLTSPIVLPPTPPALAILPGTGTASWIGSFVVPSTTSILTTTQVPSGVFLPHPPPSLFFKGWRELFLIQLLHK